jgi:hypothetical protein
MFERVRHSRSQRSLKRSKASRQTQRASINQRGGDYTTLSAGDVASWITAIDKYDAQHRDKPIGSIKLMFTDAIPTGEPSADKAKRINAWITMIERQDEVARIAVRMAQESFLKSLVPTGATLTPPFTLTEAAIDALKDEELGPALEPYLNELYTASPALITSLSASLKQFVDIIGMKAGIDYAKPLANLDNKFEYMFADILPADVKTSEIINLLINPAVSENTLMQLICSNITLLFSKKNGKYMVEDILKDISTTRTVTSPAEIAKLKAYATKYAYTIFGSLQVRTLRAARDGFVLAGEPVVINTNDPTIFEDLINFWSNFFKKLIENYDGTTFTPLPPFIVAVTDHYGTLAAYSCLIKREKVTLESKLDPAGTYIALAGAAPAFVGYPNVEYHTVQYQGGKTLAEVFRSIDDVSFLFMKHLLANISVE